MLIARHNEGEKVSAPDPTISEICSRSSGFRAGAIAATLILSGLFGSASANPSTTNVVRAAHINVNPQTPAAAMHTLNQLQDAAMEACGASAFSLSEYKAAVRASRCWHDSLAEVVTRLDSTQLTRAFESALGPKRPASHQHRHGIAG
jgi:hypothetical protein